MNAATAQSLFTDTTTWRVIIERKATPRLYLLRLSADMPIRTVMKEILALYQRKQLCLVRSLSQNVVEIATFVRIFRHEIRPWNGQTYTELDINIENQSSDGQEVRIIERNPSSLTRATHHMSALSFEAPVEANGSLVAILLKPRLTHIGLSILAVAILLAIVTPGTLLGVMVGQADLGVALSAAITGILALVGKLCGWLA